PQSGAILGRPGVTTLLGGGIDQDSFSGARITAGLWLDCERTIGLEGGFFFLGTHAADFTFTGTGAPGSPALGRPFFNPLTGAEDSQLVSLPGQVSGSVRASLATELGGAEVNGLCNVCCGCQGRVDLLGGFRYLYLRERLDVGEDLLAAPTLPLTGGSRF